MKKIYKSTVEGDVIHLKEGIELPMGTHAIITLKTINKEKQEDIKNGSTGFSVGTYLAFHRKTK